MKLKTSITVIAGCLIIFLFILLPVFLSIEKKEDEYVSKFQSSKPSTKTLRNQYYRAKELIESGEIKRYLPPQP